MTPIEQLIEDYERRVQTICSELILIKIPKKTQDRLITKRSCYRTFIAELNRIVNSPINNAIPYESLSDEFKKSIDSIEQKLTKFPTNELKNLENPK
jgi:septation ring formation regulator EzrA